MTLNAANLFLVGLLDDTIIAGGLSPRRLTREEALNVAAYLIVNADCLAIGQGIRDDRTGPAMVFVQERVALSAEFVDLLEEVQGS